MAGPSKRDREKLRERVKTELRKLGRTQKDLEASLDVTSGTLTRVFGGRRKLDQELADGLAKELDTTVAELFRATSYLKQLDAPAEAEKKAPAKKAAPKKKAAKKEKAPTAEAPKKEAALKKEAAPKAEKAAPKKESAPKPEPKKAAAPKPAPRPEPPPPEEPRFRKRDIPLKAARFVLGLVFGD